MSSQQSDVELVEHYYNRDVVAFSCFFGLGILFVCLRFYARWTTDERGSWGWDDAIMLPALLSFIAYAATAIGNKSAPTPTSAVMRLGYHYQRETNILYSRTALGIEIRRSSDSK